VIVKGAEESGRYLDGINKKARRSILRKGLRAGGNILQNEMKADAPSLSGRIRKNIKIRAGRKARPGSVTLSVGIGAKDFQGETFYGGFLLWGHKVGSRKLGDSRATVPGNDFINRAYEAKGDEAGKVTVDKIGELIDEAAHA